MLFCGGNVIVSILLYLKNEKAKEKWSNRDYGWVKNECEKAKIMRLKCKQCESSELYLVFLLWLVVQFTKLNLTRNLFKFSSFSFRSTKRTIATTFTFIFSFQRFLSVRNDITKWQQREKATILPKVEKTTRGKCQQSMLLYQIKKYYKCQPRKKLFFTLINVELCRYSLCHRQSKQHECPYAW